MKIKNLIVVTAATSALILGCSSKIQKADISDTANPAQEISRLDFEVQEGYKQQLDVLANKDFTQAQKYLTEAKDDLASDQSQKEVLEDVAYAEAYMQKARQTAEVRSPKVSSVLEVREKALAAGAHNSGPNEKTLKKIDDDLRDKAGNFDRLDADSMSEFQTRYMALELDAITENQIGNARSRIQGARDNRAARYTPSVLKKAEIDLATAENVIRANRSLPANYMASVKDANRSSELLTATLAATNGGRVDEGTATRLVAQERALRERDREISSLNTDLEGAASSQQNLKNRMEQQNERLSAANAAVNMQKTIDMARKQFSPNEAEVFQQGNKLLIRLKAMNFPSGSANLTENSMDVLSKVRDVATTLKTSEVIIEGHTDSTGKRALNEKLSEARAESVAKYMENNGLEGVKMETMGFGFEKPIATNKTKAGREQNRRVDVILTPSTSTSPVVPSAVE